MNLSDRLRPAPLAGARLEFVTRQLAALLNAGVPLERVLLALSRQADRPQVRELFESLRISVREGSSLSQALGRYPKVFSASYQGLVSAGERSGRLAFVLERLADALEAQNQLRNTLLTALAYPVIVAVVALAIVMLLMGYVVPQVVGVLSAQKQALPLLTVILIAVSDFLANWGAWLALLLLLGSGLAVFSVVRMPAFRLRVDAALLKLPGAGRMLMLSEAARFASTLSILLGGGMAMTAALSLTARASSNRWIASRLELVAGWVREGADLGRGLERAEAFPPLLVQMVMTGEKSGELQTLLEVASKEFARELKLRSQLLAAILEPALILVMGGLVLAIVLAVMMPLIEMNSLIR